MRDDDQAAKAENDLARTRALEAQDVADARSRQFGAETASTRIGAYRLVEPIGQGGMGAVWLAEQERPMQRKVALKVIKMGMDTEAVIARFEAERQALARMDHPNIAKVLDAGATETGRPFFVMEWVRGQPITEYCDERCMNTEQRLKLFCTVCHAIQHAHQKGVIHRDIKPTNVLVAEVDDQPVVKVIDFGLAKATDARLTEKTLFTQLGQMVGTPVYMSPEQAEAESDIDTRSDVYSLGILLYELLTGVTPLDTASLYNAGYAEIQRMIREVELPRMSHRLSSLGPSSKIAAGRRSTDPRRLTQIVRGDLDIIVMKALEKERGRRYATPSSFAQDIMRYMRREAIEARPASWGYRAQRFWARNRVAAGTTVLVALALVLGTVISVWLAVRASRAASAERIAKEQAERRLKQVERGAEILGKIFEDVDLRRIEGEGQRLDQVLGERLKDAASQLSMGMVGDEQVMATLQAQLGQSLYNFGHFEESIRLFEQAAETRKRVLGSNDSLTLATQHNLAECYVLARRYDLAIPLHAYVLERSRATLGDTHYDTVGSMKDLGNALVATGDYKAGLPLLEEALKVARASVDNDDELCLTAMNSLAVAYHNSGQLERAMPLYEESLEIRRRTYGEEHFDTMTGMNNLATCFYAMKQVDKALPLMQQVFLLRKHKLGVGHPHTITSMTNLAVLLEGSGQGAQALPLFEEALEISEANLGPIHPDTLVRIRNLANCCRDLGEIDRAMRLYQEYVERNKERDGPESLPYADALVYLGFNQSRLARWADAEPVLRECLRLRSMLLTKDDWRVASTQSLLGATLMELGKLEEAEPLLIAGYQGQKANEAAMPANARIGIAQALNRVITYYERRDAEGDEAIVEQWKAKQGE